MFSLMVITLACIFGCCLWIFLASYATGRTFIIKGNKGRRLNPFERFFDGFLALMKM